VGAGGDFWVIGVVVAWKQFVYLLNQERAMQAGEQQEKADWDKQAYWKKSFSFFDKLILKGLWMAEVDRAHAYTRRGLAQLGRQSKIRIDKPSTDEPSPVSLEMLMNHPQVAAMKSYSEYYRRGDFDAANEVMVCAVQKWPGSKEEWECLPVFLQCKKDRYDGRLLLTLESIIKDPAYPGPLRIMAAIFRVSGGTDLLAETRNQRLAKATLSLCDFLETNSEWKGQWKGFLDLERSRCLRILGRNDEANIAYEKAFAVGEAIGSACAYKQCLDFFNDENWDRFFLAVTLMFSKFIIAPGPLVYGPFGNLRLNATFEQPLVGNEISNGSALLLREGQVSKWYTRRLLNVAHLVAKSCTSHDRLRKACRIWDEILISDDIPPELRRLASSELRVYRGVYPDRSKPWDSFTIDLELLEQLGTKIDLKRLDNGNT